MRRYFSVIFLFLVHSFFFRKVVRTFLVFIICFQFSFLLPAQQIWYFGYGAGLKFSSSVTQPLSGSKLFTNEGCAVGNDEKGNILFYTDGVTVWDKSHSVIGEGLNGNSSSTQSALIVPKPGDKNMFYIFTVDTLGGGKGACYSVLDISKKKVVLKNQKILFPVTEKLSAVSHANEKDVWVLIHKWNSSDFYACLVSEKGLGNPVISSIGLIHKETGAGKNREAIGEMKFSSDEKKIAIAIPYRKTNNLEVFDFDNSSGIVSNPVTNSVDGFPYGLCFSPDNSKLYISLLKGVHGIVQYDLKSKQFVGITSNEMENSFGSMQLGPAGKIYVARTGSYLDLINEPDKLGKECNYQKNAVGLSPSTSTYGLPNNWTFFSEKKNCEQIIEKNPISKDLNFYVGISVCENEMILDAKNFGAHYLWSTGEKSKTIKIDTSGIFYVEIAKENCRTKDSIRIIFKKNLAVFRYLSAFNPESEFLNPEFYYTIDEVDAFDLKVFDKKKKNILFETKNSEKKWNGKNSKGEFVPAGDYNWTVTYRPRCPKGAKAITMEGKVAVKRGKL